MEQPYLIHLSVYEHLAKLSKKATQLFYGELAVTIQDRQAAIKLPAKLHASARELVACGVAIETSEGLFGLNHEFVKVGPAEPEMGEIIHLPSPRQTGTKEDPMNTIRQYDIAERNKLMDQLFADNDMREMGPYAFMVLTCLVASLDDLTVPKMAERTGMTVARVHAGLRILRDMGYVLEEKEPRYRLGGSKLP